MGWGIDLATKRPQSLASMGAPAELDAAEQNGGVSIADVGPLADAREGGEDTVVVNTLYFAYTGHKPLISDFSLRLPRGSRCLLVGANGAGSQHCLSTVCSCKGVCKHAAYTVICGV